LIWTKRIARLEAQMQSISDDVAEIKREQRLLVEAFQQTKGFKGAVYVFGALFLLAVGASFKEVAGWILAALKP